MKTESTIYTPVQCSLWTLVRALLAYLHPPCASVESLTLPGFITGEGSFFMSRDGLQNEINFHAYAEPAMEAKIWVIRTLVSGGHHPDQITDAVMDAIQCTPRSGYKYHFLRCILRELETSYDNGLFVQEALGCGPSRKSRIDARPVDLDYVDHRIREELEARERELIAEMEQKRDKRVGESSFYTQCG